MANVIFNTKLRFSTSGLCARSRYRSAISKKQNAPGEHHEPEVAASSLAPESSDVQRGVKRLLLAETARPAFSLFAIAFALDVLFSFRELGPGLGHFDQQGLIRPIRRLTGQADAFGRAPSVILKSGHGTLRLRANASARALFRIAAIIWAG
jgi:hypothetical protein